MLKNIANFNNINDYLPLFNAVLITDLFVIFLLNIKVIKSQVLQKWYSQYNLSAVIADVLIILIGLIITRAIYYYIFDNFSLSKFIITAVIVQIIHDIFFYIFFTNTPRGVSRMLDTFKDYANDVSYKAIFADSGMIIMACLIASYLVNKSTNTNIIVLISSLYLLPYLLYN
jgi:branched-subunit amino acid ABC-type transport system permease component